MRQLKVTASITTRGSLCLDKYLLEIAKIPLLPPEEEIRLTQLIKNGEKKALQTLIKANLRFVVSVAKQYQFRGLALIDLINDGNLGLIKAAEKFDASKGFKFISYAVWWIRQSIIQAINDKARLVRLPSNKANLSNHILNSTSTLMQELEREPSVDEIAAHLNVGVQEVSQVKDNLFHLSLDMPVGEQGAELTLGDRINNDEIQAKDRATLHTESLRVEVTRCLASLPGIEREILCLFFGIGETAPATLKGIAHRLNLSEERVRQLKNKGVQQLRTVKRSSLLKPFLG